MRSPRHPASTLEARELEPGLPAFVCPHSGGWWIDGEQYWRWIRRGATVNTGAPRPVPVALDDDDGALISPRSGRLMRKFRVGGTPDFRIDVDTVTGGFWLDQHEYDLLRTRGLHAQLHLIADESWQQALRAEAALAVTRARARSQLSETAAVHTDAFAEWARSQDTRSVLAYLMTLLDE